MAGTQPELPMILGNCISCNGLMRVPVTTDVSHVARCPHCDTRFPVQQLIASAIPAAEIMEGENASELPAVDRVLELDDGPKERNKFEVPKQLYDGAKHRKRRRRRRSRSSDERKENAVSRGGGGGSGQVSSRRRIDASKVPLASTQSAESVESAESAAPVEPAAPVESVKSVVSAESPASVDKTEPVEMTPTPSSTSTASSSSTTTSSSRSGSRSNSSDRSEERSRSSSSRSRSSSRRSSSRNDFDEDESSMLEWGKIVAGGMIAFPLAYLGMMWITGLDPFSMAPKIESVVPALVPASLSERVEDPIDINPRADEDTDQFDGFDDDSLPVPSLDPDEVRG